MSSAPSPHTPPPPDRPEWRTALLTFGPAIVVAFLLEGVLSARLGWSPRRALLTSLGVGIAIALLLQRVLARRDGR
jgi:hypothetical protein